MLHAAAAIHKDTDADRNAKIVRKEGQLLLLTILEDFEIIDLKTIHVLPAFVENRRHHVDQFHGYSEFISRIVLIRRRLVRVRGSLRGCCLSRRRCCLSRGRWCLSRGWLCLSRGRWRYRRLCGNNQTNC